MKIGFDAKRAFQNNTGLGNYARFVISGLAEHFPENDYLLYTTGSGEHRELSPVLLRSHVRTQRIGTGVAGTWNRLAGMKRFLSADLPDLFHGLSNELPLGIPATVKPIVSIHDLLFLRYPDFYPFLDRQIYLAKTRYACQKAEVVIAISQQTKQDLIQYLKVPEGKIKVHYQSCHPQFLQNYSKESIDSVLQKYSISKPYILQVGTLEERKNALLTLKAFASGHFHTDFQLVFAGKKTGYCRELYQFVQQHQLDKKVLFLHDAAFPDFPLLYQGATLSVYPSLFEGFGIPVLEAMCSGTPVITSLGSCFAEVGGEAAAYIDPKDVSGFGQAIDNLLSDFSERESMKQKGRARATLFESKKLTEELHAIYTSIVHA